MRKVVLTLAMMLAGGPAMAYSIEHVRGDRTSNDSVVFINCASCPAPAQAAAVEPAAPVLQPGTQSISVREVDGRKETVRTEAWLGGSPVTYVSANPLWLPSADATAALAVEPAPVDAATTTSAVETATSNDVSLLETVEDTPLRQAR